MRLWMRRIGLTVGGVLLAAQFVPVNRANPPADPALSIYATQTVPPDVRRVLDGSCNDCHSNQTAWPWYSYVAPVSWMVARDVHQARKAINFSEWGSYSAKKKEEKLEELCEQLVNGDMPDRKYLLLHRSSRPTAQEREAVCQWTEDARDY